MIPNLFDLYAVQICKDYFIQLMGRGRKKWVCR